MNQHGAVCGERLYSSADAAAAGIVCSRRYVRWPAASSSRVSAATALTSSTFSSALSRLRPWCRWVSRVTANWRCRGMGGVICVFTGNLQQPPAKLCLCTICLQCFDTVVWMTGTTSDLYKAVCWFVGGDILTGALHVLQLQLSPPPSSLAPIKSRMETFWYRLT